MSFLRLRHQSAAFKEYVLLLHFFSKNLFKLLKPVPCMLSAVPFLALYKEILNYCPTLMKFGEISQFHK